MNSTSENKKKFLEQQKKKQSGEIRESIAKLDAGLEMLEKEECAEGLVRYLSESPWDSLLKDTCEAKKINYRKLPAVEVQAKLRNALEKEIEIVI